MNYKLSVLCLLLLSCQSDDQPSPQGGIEGGQDGDQVAVAFRATTAALLTTRADGTLRLADAFSAGDQIGVFAYYTGQADFSDASTPNFMFNQSVALGSDGLWTYAPTKYWPNAAGDHLSFTGYYPYSTESAHGITLSANDRAGMPAIGFTTQTAAGSQVDLMACSPMLNCTHTTDPDNETDDPAAGVYRSTTARVPLVLHHALAQLRFYIYVETEGTWAFEDDDHNPDKSKIQIDLALAGVYTTGTLTLPSTAIGAYTFADTDGDGNSRVNSWAARGGVDDGGGALVALKADDYAHLGVVYDGATAKIKVDPATIDAKDFFCVVPQAFTVDAAEATAKGYAGGKATAPTLTVTAKDTRDDNERLAGEPRLDDVSYTVSLATATSTVTEWRGGYIYNYLLKLHLGETVWGYFLSPLEAEQW